MKKIAVFIITVFVLFSCGENKPFEHRISESNVGEILIYNTELPPVFEVLITDGIIYSFRLPVNSNKTGYWQDKQWELPKFSNDQKISEEDLDRGWYFADIDARKENTPETWIWVKSGEVRAFVDKLQVWNFIQEYGDKLPDLTKRQPAPVPAG